MKQVKIDIFNALKNKPILGAIYAGWPPSAVSFPRTVYYQVSGVTGIADGRMSGNDELYSVDLFAKTMAETEDMALVVDEAMNSLPYIVSREGSTDLYEQDTQVYHKVLRYRIKS